MPLALRLLVVLVVVPALEISASTSPDCVEVWLRLTSQCAEEDVEECEAGCEPVTRKECHILMRKVYSPVLVTHCSAAAPAHAGSCEGGERRHCSVKFSTSCRTTRRYTEIEEDSPLCRTETVNEVEVNRCEVVRRRRRKMLPEVSCRRVPRTECVTRGCHQPPPTPRSAHGRVCCRCSDTSVALNNFESLD